MLTREDFLFGQFSKEHFQRILDWLELGHPRAINIYGITMIRYKSDGKIRCDHCDTFRRIDVYYCSCCPLSKYCLPCFKKKMESFTK